MEELVEVWMDGQTDKWMEGWMDGGRDGQLNEFNYMMDGWWD